MAKKLPNLKTTIPPKETVFYVFQLSPAEYMLYDSYLGDPVCYGSLNKVSGKLSLHFDKLNERKKEGEIKTELFVWKFVRDAIKGWKLVNNMNGIDYITPKKEQSGVMAAVNPRSPLKDIGYDKIYYWIDMGNMNYLYDSDMGSPIWFGSSSKVKGAITVHSEKHAFSVQVFYLPPKASPPQWKMSIRYKMTAEEEQNTLEKDKKEETQQAKM